MYLRVLSKMSTFDVLKEFDYKSIEYLDRINN